MVYQFNNLSKRYEVSRIICSHQEKYCSIVSTSTTIIVDNTYFLPMSNSGCFCDTVRPLLSEVHGRTKFWSQEPQIIEFRG